MLANPLEHLRAGRASGWAVGGFNVYNLARWRIARDLSSITTEQMREVD